MRRGILLHVPYLSAYWLLMGFKKGKSSLHHQNRYNSYLLKYSLVLKILQQIFATAEEIVDDAFIAIQYFKFTIFKRLDCSEGMPKKTIMKFMLYRIMQNDSNYSYLLNPILCIYTHLYTNKNLFNDCCHGIKQNNTNNNYFKG